MGAVYYVRVVNVTLGNERTGEITRNEERQDRAGEYSVRNQEDVPIKFNPVAVCEPPIGRASPMLSMT